MFKNFLILILFLTLFLLIAHRFFYVDFVKEFSKKYNVPENLIFAMIYEESKFNRFAKSNKDALGLMQIMPETAKEIAKELHIQNFKREMLFEPKVNIEIGVYYFSKLLKKYNGDLKFALAAYNAGPKVVDSWDKKRGIPYKETEKFVRNILKNFKFLAFLR